MVKFVADIEMSITQEELVKFTTLGKHLEINFGDVVRRCANERCEELIKEYSLDANPDT